MPHTRAWLLLTTLFLSLLHNVSAVQISEPDGIFFEQTDWTITDSEPLLFTMTVAGQTSAVPEIEFELLDLKHHCHFQGIIQQAHKTRVDFSDKPDSDLWIYRLLEPNQVQQLPTGWYTLKVRKTATKKWTNTKVYRKQTPNCKRVVYLLDNLSPEGYADLLNTGSLSTAIESLRAFPQQGMPDLVVVSHYAPMNDATFEQLQNYLHHGGKALFVGLNHKRLDALSALQFTDKQTSPARRTMDQKVVSNMGIDFSNAQNQMRCFEMTLHPQALLHYQFTDHAPLLASRVIGNGDVYSLATGLKAGMLYQTIVSHLLNLPTPSQPQNQPHKNIGRFAYTQADGIGSLKLFDDFSFNLWDIKNRRFRVTFPDVFTRTPVKVSCKQANWVSKTLLLEDGEFGGAKITYGLATPGVYYQQDRSAQAQISMKDAAYVAIWKNGKLNTHALEKGKWLTPDADPRWFLFWQDPQAPQNQSLHWPLLVCVDQPIKNLGIKQDNKLLVNFASPGIDLTA